MRRDGEEFMDENYAWICIRCDKSMRNIMGQIQPHNGTVFLGSPGYGSSLDGDHVELDNVNEYAIALCDDCLKNHRDKVKGINLIPQKSWFQRASVVKLAKQRDSRG